MRRLFVFVILFLLSVPVIAQRIAGFVKDTKGVGVPGASVAVKGSYDGGTSDSTGRFSFTTSEKGAIVVVVSAIGYKTVEASVPAGQAGGLSITLKEEITELKAVVISAGSFEASDKKKATVLSPIDIVTTASANADVTGAVKTLPGAQQVGESEGLFVRGGTAQETKTYIDGTLVNNFFYSSVPGIAQRGRFSPFIFKGTVFSAGGYSALYGQALSSALILESIDLPEMSSGSAGISVIGVNGGYQKLARNKRSSWGVSYGYTNLALAFALLKQIPEYPQVPAYHTGDANFRIKTSGTGMLKYYGYFSQNVLGLRRPSIDTPGYKDAFKLKNFNMYHNVSYKETIGRWKLAAGLSFATSADDVKGDLVDANNKTVSLAGMEDKSFSYDADGQYVNAKLVLDYRLKGLSAVRFGSEYNYSRDQNKFRRYTGVVYPSTVAEHLTSLFGEADVYVTNNLAAKVGGRLEHSAILEKVNVAPRLSLAYKTGAESQASVAYGIFYQDPERRYFPAQNGLDFAKATHYIAQFQKTNAKQTLRTEIFYKRYQHLVKTAETFGQTTATGSTGYGDAQGFEVFWRDKATIKNFDYWISYSYLDTKRDYLNFPTAIEPSFAARHTASLVMKKFVSSMQTQFNASYTYATGRPYYNIRYDGSKYAIYDQGRTKDYNSMSISVNYLPNLFKKNAGAGRYSVIVFSVTNVMGADNVYGYNYSSNGIRKVAIVPPSKTFVFLGAFINFGLDRREDVINSNL
ncbi:MAG: TonB-dependent receptor [Flaviaesturariibacter sp.]|nr:TonB-dependent receptor [Flaviaesturariibacter sp.]